MSDTVRIDFAGNDPLKAALGGLQAGDEFEFTIKGVVKNLNQDSLEGSLTRIEVPGAEDEEDEDVKVTGDEPASVMIKMMGGDGG